MVSGASQELLLKQQKLLTTVGEDVAHVLLEAGPHNASRMTDRPQNALAQEQTYHEEEDVENRAGKYEQRMPEEEQEAQAEVEKVEPGPKPKPAPAPEQVQEESAVLVESKWAESKRLHEEKRAAEEQRLQAVRLQPEAIVFACALRLQKQCQRWRCLLALRVPDNYCPASVRSFHPTDLLPESQVREVQELERQVAELEALAAASRAVPNR